jgi:hypothetical protein
MTNRCPWGLLPLGSWLWHEALFWHLWLTVAHRVSHPEGLGSVHEATHALMTNGATCSVSADMGLCSKFGAPLLCEHALSLLADEHPAIQTVWMLLPQQRSYTQGLL